MYFEFYIDQFAAEHLLSGYLLFTAAAGILGRNVSRKRRLMGSTVNVFVLLMLIISGKRGLDLIGMVFGGLVVFHEAGLGKQIWQIYRKTPEKGREILYQAAGSCIRTGAVLLFVTIFFGGALEAVTALFGLPVFAGIVCAGAAASAFAGAQRLQKKKRTICTVCLYWGTRSCTLKALLDTGNSLKEPLTGKPVSIIQSAEAKEFLGDGWEAEKGFFLIPYRSLGTEKSWMRAVRIDRMRLMQQGKEQEVPEPILAIYEGRISGDGGCQMILHPEHAGPLA